MLGWRRAWRGDQGLGARGAGRRSARRTSRLIEGRTIRGTTHSVIGGAIGLGVEGLHPLAYRAPAALGAIDLHLVRGVGPLVATGLMILLGAFVARVPDLDFRFGLSHRGITHSLVAAVAVALFVGAVTGAFLPAPAAIELAAVTGVAYLSHIAADSVNPMPVAILWPLPRRRPGWLPSVREDSLAGTAVEWVVWVGIAVLIVWPVRAGE